MSYINNYIYSYNIFFSSSVNIDTIIIVCIFKQFLQLMLLHLGEEEIFVRAMAGQESSSPLIQCSRERVLLSPPRGRLAVHSLADRAEHKRQTLG